MSNRSDSFSSTSSAESVPNSHLQSKRVEESVKKASLPLFPIYDEGVMDPVDEDVSAEISAEMNEKSTDKVEESKKVEVKPGRASMDIHPIFEH